MEPRSIGGLSSRLARNTAVTARWHFKQRVRIFSRSHSPPPSETGRMWSASQRLFRERRPGRRPHSAKALSRAAPRDRFSCFQAARQSTPHWAQIPRSRSNTFSRRKPGSVRRRHSVTHHSEQNVMRPFGTSRLHHRHRLRPFSPLARVERSTHPPGMVRALVMADYDVPAAGIVNGRTAFPSSDFFIYTTF